MDYFVKFEFSPLAAPHAGRPEAKMLRDWGFSGVELSYAQPYTTSRQWRNYLRRVAILKDTGFAFTVHAPIIDFNLGSLNRGVRSASRMQLRRSLDFARKQQASLVVVHPGTSVFGILDGDWNRADFVPETSMEQQRFADSEAECIRSLQEAADYAPDIVLAVENMVYPHERYRSPQALASLLAAVGRSSVGLTLDLGHAWASGSDPRHFLPALGDRLRHIHLHDNNGIRDEHLPVGQGTIPKSDILKALASLQYRGRINLECTVDATTIDQLRSAAAGHRPQLWAAEAR